jgi:hypothetical protein
MAESAALLVDEVLLEQAIRQWELSFPFQLRFIRRFAPHASGQLKLFKIARNDFVRLKSRGLNRLRPDRRIFQV